MTDYLSQADVLAMHADQIKRYGGAHGIPRPMQRSHQEPEVRITYRSRATHARPETVPAEKLRALASLLAVYHDGRWVSGA